MAEKYKHLENQIFVMSGRLVVSEKEQGNHLTHVEYNLCQVVG